MLHNIPEICEALDKTRSEIYAMLNNGAMSYVVGQDGKRRIETSELRRVFPELPLDKLVDETSLENFAPQQTDNASATHAKAPPSTQTKAADNTQESNKSIRLGDTSGADAALKQQQQTQEIHELRGMLTDLRKEIDNVLEDNRRLLRLLEYQTLQGRAEDSTEAEDSRPASTEMAKQGWKHYKKMRADQKETPPQKEGSGFWPALKRFFLKY